MTRGNLNYQLYLAGHGAVHALRRLAPVRLVPPRRNLSSAFAIGITTYCERYDTFFRPLYRNLARIFPEVPISVAVNGHGDAAGQQRYLARLEADLCATAPAHHAFFLHDRPIGLTRLWNEILLRHGSVPTLLLNDDLVAHAWLRRWAEAFDWEAVDLTLINSTWSHFVIAPRTLRRVGAFDPGFPGIGFEDMDYTARAGLAGVAIANVLCPYLQHRDHQPTSTSFDALSDRVWGKYTSANEAHFFSKWERCGKEEGGVYVKQIHSHVRPTGPLAPVPFEPAGARGPAVVHPDRS